MSARPPPTYPLHNPHFPPPVPPTPLRPIATSAAPWLCPLPTTWCSFTLACTTPLAASTSRHACLTACCPVPSLSCLSASLPSCMATSFSAYSCPAAPVMSHALPVAWALQVSAGERQQLEGLLPGAVAVDCGGNHFGASVSGGGQLHIRGLDFRRCVATQGGAFKVTSLPATAALSAVLWGCCGGATSSLPALSPPAIPPAAEPISGRGWPRGTCLHAATHAACPAACCGRCRVAAATSLSAASPWRGTQPAAPAPRTGEGRCTSAPALGWAWRM